jgi:hypothetical protein
MLRRNGTVAVDVRRTVWIAEVLGHFDNRHLLAGVHTDRIELFEHARWIIHGADVDCECGRASRTRVVGRRQRHGNWTIGIGHQGKLQCGIGG